MKRRSTIRHSLIVLGLVVSFMLSGSWPTLAEAGAGSARFACDETSYAADGPWSKSAKPVPGAAIGWYGGGDLWVHASLVDGRWYAGAEGVMVAFMAPAGREWSARGKRLDAPARPMLAWIAQREGGEQLGQLVFPTEGCWRVRARADDKEVVFVVRVRPADEHPYWTGVARDVPQGTGGWKALRRPLDLPVLSPGSPCPVAKRRTVSPNYGLALGDGPAYAVPFTWGHDGEGGGWAAKVLWVVSPDYPGPLLIRGRRLDGPEEMRFGRGVYPSAELQLIGGIRADRGGWRGYPSYPRVSGPGCYAWRVDGWDFSEIIVVLA